MTSLYFEAEDEDDLRKTGFSKDGKFQNPQIMLGLLVGEKPLGVADKILPIEKTFAHPLRSSREDRKGGRKMWR